MRDDDVIKAADDAGLAMVLTGMRHFRHWKEEVKTERETL